MDKHDKAEHMFYLAQQLNPDCPICFYNIGNSLFSQQNYKRAVWCWQRTAELEPTHPQINYRIAQAYWANGNKAQSREYFLKELRNSPGDIDVIFDFGIFLLECGDIESGKEKFNRILEFDPDFARAYFYLGEIALRCNDLVEAEKQYMLATEHDIELGGARYRLGQIALEDGDVETANELISGELLLDLDDNNIMLSIGSMLIEMKDYDRATDCFLRIVDRDKKCGEAFYHLGICLAMQGDSAGALSFFEHAIEVGFLDGGLLAETAFLQLKCGQLSLAAKTIGKAEALCENDRQIRLLKWRIRFSCMVRRLKNRFWGRGRDIAKLLGARCKGKILRILNINR
jgi:tetratricopeptide (TPR) repeat protein